METLLLLVPFLVPVVVANLSERQRQKPYHLSGGEGRDPGLERTLDLALRYLPYALLILINLSLLGIAALALLNQVAIMLVPEMVADQPLSSNWWGVAVAAFLTAIVASLFLIPAVRRWLAGFLPLDPDSPVHTTALAYAAYLIGSSLGQMVLIGDLENLTNIDLGLDIWDVVLSGVPLVLIGLAGVGLFIRRDWRTTLQRLGLLRPTWQQLLLAVGLTILLLAFDWGVNYAWERLDPAGYDMLERVTESIFGDLMTVGGAVALGLSAGISEELLFRGAVQPRLGLLVATILFAIGHLQYGLTVATLEVFVIGLVLGLVRYRTHTTICILIHAGYNSMGVLLGLLQP